MVKKGLVILNPNANKGKGASLEKEIIQAFKDENININIVKSSAQDDCRQYAYDNVEIYDFICAVGGDGTVNEVVDGILKKARDKVIDIDDLPFFAMIPVGRGNDFAWMLNLRDNTIKTLVSKIKEEKTKLIDIGFCKGGKYSNGCHFVNGLGIGFEPSVNFVASEYKRISGTFSYICALFHMLRKYPEPFNLIIEKESGTINIKSQQLSIGNGRRMGGAFLMTPKAILDDGYLDFVYAHEPISKNKILKTAIKFLSGKQLYDKNFTFSREKWVNVIAQNCAMPIHIDGEMVGKNVEKIEIYIRNKVLKVIY